MRKTIDEQAKDILFREARTFNTWLDEPVSDETLRSVYELMRFGPTSANTCPARIVFLRTDEARERLKPALWPQNVEKTLSAPVTAIIGYDLKFADNLPQLFPHNPDMKDLFQDTDFILDTAYRNGSLQGAYLIIAARAVGLDCGPMSGFDLQAVDEEFFSGEKNMFPGQTVKSNFLCNMGYGRRDDLFPRNPRLRFDQACVLR